MTEKDPKDWTSLERIQFLLDQWDAIHDGAAAGKGTSGDPLGIPLIPEMANHPTVVELRRCLGLLSTEDPPAYRHLKSFRCGAQWRQVRAKTSFRGPNGRMIEGDGWRMERVTPDWISGRLVCRAEEWLERHFNGPLFIPKDLWDGLNKPVSV